MEIDGYDPYDYYDLGEFDQKGGAPNWFGSKAELLDLIQSAHALGLQVYADLVFNHNSGGDAQELNPIDRQSRWTKSDPKSGKFSRDWKCFHPSQYETWESATFDDMPDLCHRTPLVYTELINYARWLLEEIGFDGFRYDVVKGLNTMEQHAPCSGRWRGHNDPGVPKEKNGLTSPAGLTSGRRLEVTRCTCRSKVGSLGLQTPPPDNYSLVSRKGRCCLYNSSRCLNPWSIVSKPFPALSVRCSKSFRFESHLVVS
jgi:hypothetical protein